MKRIFLSALLLSSAFAGFSQNITSDQVKTNLVKVWKGSYSLLNGMRLDPKAGVPMMVVECKADNSLQFYSSLDQNNKFSGSWKYFPDKKRIQIKVAGSERGFITSLSADEMSMQFDTSKMGGDDGAEMIMVFSPAS